MERLEKYIKKYHNKVITTVQVIEELIDIAKNIQAKDKEPKAMNLSEEEHGFYTAVANNKNALELMSKEQLRELAVAVTN